MYASDTSSQQNVDFLQGDFQVGICKFYEKKLQTQFSVLTFPVMENGSGGLITDVNFFGGGIGKI